MDGSVIFLCIDLGVGGAEAPASVSLVQQYVGQLWDMTSARAVSEVSLACRSLQALGAAGSSKPPVLHTDVHYECS